MKPNKDKNIELSMNDHFREKGNLLSKESQANESSSEINTSHKKNLKCIISLIVISIIIIGGIVAAYFFLFHKDSTPETQIPSSPIEPYPEWSKEIKDVFSPSFKINSTENTLIQI